MPRKRKLSNLSGRCRFCLIDHGCMTDLFSESVEIKTKDLMKCTAIDIKYENDLPNNVCHLCLYKLEMWNDFKEQFLRSNRLLLQYVEISEFSDNATKKKRTESPRSTEENLSNDVEKSDIQFPLTTNVKSPVEQTYETIHISDEQPASPIAHNVITDDTKGETESKTEESSRTKSLSTITKIRSLVGRRGRTNERRRASMKRWFARKKALLAATGETISDSDSMASDDAHLSPVQKARAKTNADKEAERQKRLTKALKMLETNMTGKYIFNSTTNVPVHTETNADGRQTRSGKISSADASVIEESGKQDNVMKTGTPNGNLTGKGNTSASVNEDKKTQNEKETFAPHFVKSEVQVGDSTYVVTSNLVIAEPRYINRTQLNNLPKECKVLNIDDESQEKNTDIIDAVQLRRVNPISSNSPEKKSMERCLSIEVEGTEVEALKKVQLELAGFIEKEMKDRLLSSQRESKKSEPAKNSCKSSYQALDQQLKIIVEKAIRKNYESAVTRDQEDAETVLNQKNSGTVPAVFIKTVLNSKKFQPKVVLNRLNITKESTIYRINNPHVLEPKNRRNVSRLDSFPTILHKRQRVPPVKYNDYNVSIVDSDSDSSDDEIIPVAPKDSTIEKTVTKEPALINEMRLTTSVREAEKVIMESASESMDSNVASQPPKSSTTMVQSKRETVTATDSSETTTTVTASEKHICKICNRCFDNRKNAEAHMSTHKTTDSSAQKPSKHKMMRCKRCHEIVEARYVKAHVCRSSRQSTNKCYVCNSTFRTEKLLVQHLNSHDQSEFNIENIAKSDSKRSGNPNPTAPHNARNLTIVKSDNAQLQKADIESVNESRNGGRTGEAINVERRKEESTKVTEKPKQTYTCFICDKIFTDEDILKDHLQKHCELSEDEQSIDVEQYQCAICGESQESGDALEVHVEKHLFDDEDDNPNLINISHESDKAKEDSYECTQCNETFKSIMLLEMHKQAHEEEAAIAEWEKQGIKVYENQCMICDAVFETEEELSDHLDVHGNIHVCQLCDRPFFTLEELQNHVETH